MTGPFKVLDCAGYKAARSILPQTKAQGIEFGGFIYSGGQNGRYFYSAPFSGTPGALPSFDIHRTQDTPSGFSLAGWFYSGQFTFVTDQAGKQKRYQYDAFGRLFNVREDQNGLDWTTDYHYCGFRRRKSFIPS